MQLFLNNGKQISFEKLPDVIQKFGHVSGLKLNMNKSTFLRVWSLKDTNLIF
jgi:hypothetical protein